MPDDLPFGFDSTDRRFWISLPGFPRLKFSPGAEIDSRTLTDFLWKPLPGESQKMEFAAKDSTGEWRLRIRAELNGAIRIALELHLKKSVRRVQLNPVVFVDLEADHVLIHGRKMGNCESLMLGREKHPPFESHAWISITRGNSTLQLSHPLKQKNVAKFSGGIAGRTIKGFSANTQFEPVRGRRLVAAPLTLRASTDGHELLVEWAETQRGDHLPEPSPQESGWNSWDYYRWTITEEEVYRNAELIAGDPVLRKHVRRIIVDDGWQYCYGEWEPNSLFPSGMKKLARNLRRMGFTPGLWFAPTIAEPHSRLAQLEPDVLATGRSGYPCLAFSCMERKGFILDPTHPKVRAWWDELFRRYANDGYRYFKLDFLAWTVPTRRFYDARATPGELMRHIVEPIRHAVGPQSRILGCNFNLDGGPGLVDDVRVSSDIHSRWKSVKENAISVAARFWAHERLWINDPDFTLCRGEETADDPNLHQLKAMLPFVRPDDPNPAGTDYLDSLVDLSEREAEVLLSLVIVSGGAMNLSDNLPRLNEKGLALLRRAVQAEKGAAAIPVDLFRTTLPAYWVQRLASGLHRVLLVNWRDRAARLELDLAALNVPRNQVRNFWTDESVSVSRGKLSSKLKPHSCLVIETH